MKPFAWIGWAVAVLLSAATLPTSAQGPAPPNGPGRQAAQWAGSLRDPQDKLRLTALEELAKLGPAAADAVPALSWNLVNDENPRARLRAAQALGAIGSAASTAIPLLLDLAGDDAEPVLVRTAAFHAANQIGPNDEKVREAFQNALGNNDSAGIVMDDLLARGPAGLPVFKELLGRPDPALRVRVATTLASRRDTTGHLELLADIAAHDSDARVRRAALEAFQFNLAGVPDAARKPLVDALDDKDPDNRRLASRAIGQLVSRPDSVDFAPRIVPHLKDEDPEVRVAVATVLSTMKPVSRDTALALIVVLGDAEPKVRMAAARGLWGVKLNDEAVAALRKMVNGGDPGGRSAAARALGLGGSHAAAAAPDLIGLLSDADPSVRRDAVEALGELRVRTALAALKGLQKDPDGGVAQAAGDAVRKIEAALKNP